MNKNYNKLTEKGYAEQLDRLFSDDELALNAHHSEGILKLLLTENEVSKVLSIPANTLRASRSTGRLWGVQAPAFLKFGNRTVRYRVTDVTKWLDKFETYNNTAQTTF
jgi:hypothetical protein